MIDDLLEIEAMQGQLAVLERRATRLARAVGMIAVALALTAALGGAAAYRLSRLARTDQLSDGAQIVLRDARGGVRAALGVRADGGVALVLVDAEARPRAMLGLGRDGVPALGLSDNQGRLRAALAVAADGSANVGFFDQAQTVRTTLGTAGDGAPALSLVDDDRRVRAALQTDTDGASRLRLFDRAGQARVALGISHDTPSLVMRDQEGAIVSRTPDLQPLGDDRLGPDERR